MIPSSNCTFSFLNLLHQKCEKNFLLFCLVYVKMDELLDHLDVDYNFFNKSSSNHQQNFGSSYYSSDHFNQQCNTEHLDNESNFKSIHLNIHAFSANGLDFKVHLATLKVKFDVICLTETWLNFADENIILFPGYTSYHSIREQRRGGGVSVFINSKFESNQLHDHSFNFDF